MEDTLKETTKGQHVVKTRVIMDFFERLLKSSRDEPETTLGMGTHASHTAKMVSWQVKRVRLIEVLGTFSNFSRRKNTSKIHKAIRMVMFFKIFKPHHGQHCGWSIISFVFFFSESPPHGKYCQPHWNQVPFKNTCLFLVKQSFNINGIFFVTLSYTTWAIGIKRPPRALERWDTSVGTEDNWSVRRVRVSFATLAVTVCMCLYVSYNNNHVACL